MVVLVFLGTEVLAQRYPFRNYSIEEGLSESAVHALTQDDEGYLWLGTGYGLNRFNGLSFDNYFEENGLNNSIIRVLYKDSRGVIWIGTDEGVNFWKDDSIQTSPEYDVLSNSSIISAHEDRVGDMWFGTDGDGVWHFSNEGELIRQYSITNGMIGNYINDIGEDPNGGLWFATDKGLTTLRDGNFRNYTKANGYPFTRISDIAIEWNGVVWIGTNEGLVRMEDDSLQTFTTSEGMAGNKVQTLTLDIDGGIWISTRSGVSYFDGNGFENYTTESGLTDNVIVSSFIDREGNMWFGSFGGGVSLFLGNYIENFTSEQGLPNDMVTSITSSRQEKMWIGMYGGGITTLQEGVFVDPLKNSGIPDNQVLDVYTDSQERVWVGMLEGLALIEDGEIRTFSEREFPYRNVRDILETSSGDFWISTYVNGIVRYDGEEFVLFDEEKGLADNTVLGTVEGRDGSIWIATYGGVSQFYNGEFENYSIQEGLPNNAVMYLMKDRDGTIWAATSGGIAWYDGAGFQSITTEDGLPDRVCYFIKQSKDGYYWIGTTNGVVRFRSDLYFSENPSIRGQAFQMITKDQGLVANELNLGAVHEDNEGHLWFGTVGGMSHFYPSRYEGNPVPPEVHILEIQASGRNYGYTNDLVLSDKENFIEISFFGINFKAPNQVIYEYRMSEIDPGWQETTDRVARYPSLPPGEYTFQVHARNTNGTWSQKIDSLSLTIKAPFWMQWWFITIIALIAVGIILLFYNYYRVRKMVDIERMRVRIASDLHDDVGASLTEIALQSDFLQAGNINSDFKKSLHQIGKQCRKIVSSLDDIVWSIDARNDTLGDLTDRMQDYILNTLESKQMNVQYDFEDLKMNNKLPVPAKENLYLIFKEAVNNIAKYSNGDKVKIQMLNRNGKFKLTIFDNGTTGKGKKKTGHGLRNMKMRANRINADINFETEDGFKIILEGRINVN